MNLIEIPDFYKDNDTVYHYTTTETSLLYILKDMKLRLSLRSKSNDPIENTEYFFSFNQDDLEKGTTEIKNLEDQAYQLYIESKNLINKTKQLCFCKNNMTESNSFETIFPMEKYGFAKTRMWEQYGDKYKGVCIAFSLRELKKIADINNFHNRDIDYITYRELENKRQSIAYNEIKHLGYENYKLSYIEYLKKYLFYKHKDYVNENEFRICSFNEEEFDFLDIKSAIKGIIVSNIGLNLYLINSFARIIKEIESINFQILNFSNTGIELEDYRNYLK